MIVKVDFTKKDEVLLEKLDALCSSQYRSRPMMIKYILSEYLKGLDIEEPIVAKETIKKAIEEPKIDAPEEVGAEVEEIEIPLGVFDF